MTDAPIRLPWLDPRNPRQPFPPPEQALREPNGLLALGGDLSVTRLLAAYSQGIFPWYNPDEPILWWSPDPRAILRPEQLRVSRSLGKAIRRADYAVTLDHAFGEVLQACAGERRQQRGTWLGADMREAYRQLHALGFAHSVELWRAGELIGGLYGVSLGQVFFGESMFSRQTDASKIALSWFCRQLQAWGFPLIDCQVASSHLASLGAVEISRSRFLDLLRPAVGAAGRTGRWRFDLAVPAERHHLTPRPEQASS
ncbi:MAG TPA: leucyl/phenylalanyl-tRNA--protein transferase [Nevskiaceae bacterium]|nr:leucyl/phenylalanyl-tRNA--protein transferase [Nevskiaceae bacterium]